jgi:hypothetical protein
MTFVGSVRTTTRTLKIDPDYSRIFHNPTPELKLNFHPIAVKPTGHESFRFVSSVSNPYPKQPRLLTRASPSQSM